MGCGRIADLQCLGYIEHPAAEIHAVCDVDTELARTRAEEWGAARVYGDLDALLEDSEIDAVEILTPHHLHEAHASAALRAGKHVSLQKPPTRTLEEFDRLTRAAEDSGRVLRIFENFMFYPPHQMAGAIDFVDALREGRAPAQDVFEARHTLAFALAAARSAAEGREVALAELENASVKNPSHA